MKQLKLQIGMVFLILFTAILAFGVATFYDQPLNWYLFIIVFFIGLFIQTVIAILQTEEEEDV